MHIILSELQLRRENRDCQGARGSFQLLESLSRGIKGIRILASALRNSTLSLCLPLQLSKGKDDPL